jgi:hypothetical protein
VNNAIQPVKATLSHLTNANCSQYFHVKTVRGEQVLFVTFRKNRARQKNFLAAVRQTAAFFRKTKMRLSVEKPLRQKSNPRNLAAP